MWFAKSAWRSHAISVMRLAVSFPNLRFDFAGEKHPNLLLTDHAPVRRWYAVYTVPRNEKSALRYLSLRNVETFLPTYEAARTWKVHQRVKTILPLFPTYLFVRIDRGERTKVLQTPGVLHIVGSGRNLIPLEDAEVEFLRSGLQGRKAEPYSELVVGERVRIKAGVMQGVEGTLVRKHSSLRFVLTLSLINQHAAVEVDADALESVLAGLHRSMRPV
jgi:transcription antitermination factor NusG